MVLAFAMIATAKEFRSHWRPRLRRLGVTCLASVPAVADGASWIWKPVQRVLTGWVQRRDFLCAGEHVSKCAERIHGEDTKEARSSYEQGRGLLARQGWAGVCQWVSEFLAVDDEEEGARCRRATDQLIVYYTKNLNRLICAERLKAGPSIGSGQFEGEAKT